MKKQLQKGFTLIELMIVVAIIGILASIALPAYQTYVAKSNITSIQASAAAGKTAVWQYYVEQGSMPATEAAALADTNLGTFNEMMTDALTLPGKSEGTFVPGPDGDIKTSMGYDVELKGINGNVNDQVIRFSYLDDGNALVFKCTAPAGVDNKYLPKQCQN